MECSVLTFLGPDYNLGGDQGAGRSPPKIQELESGQGFKALDPILRAPGRFSFTQSPPPPRHRGSCYGRAKGGPPYGPPLEPHRPRRGPHGPGSGPLLTLRILSKPPTSKPGSLKGLPWGEELAFTSHSGWSVLIFVSDRTGPFLPATPDSWLLCTLSALLVR